MDFHLTFRHLTRFRPAVLSSPDSFIDTILGFTSTSDQIPQREGASTQWKDWLEKYAARIESEKEEWVSASSEGDWENQREKDARLANPRFVLRQWVLEEVITKVEADAENGRSVLAKVMQVRSSIHYRLLVTGIDIRRSECRWHVTLTNPGAEKEMTNRMMNWMRRRGRRGGYVASVIEVCSGFSAAVPVKAGSRSQTGRYAILQRALGLVGRFRVEVVIVQ